MLRIMPAALLSVDFHFGKSAQKDSYKNCDSSSTSEEGGNANSLSICWFAVVAVNSTDSKQQLQHRVATRQAWPRSVGTYAC